MNQNCLHYCLESLLKHPATVARFYKPFGLFRDQEGTSLFTSLIQVLDTIPCDFTTDDELLDSEDYMPPRALGAGPASDAAVSASVHAAANPVDAGTGPADAAAAHAGAGAAAVDAPSAAQGASADRVGALSALHATLGGDVAPTLAVFVRDAGTHGVDGAYMHLDPRLPSPVPDDIDGVVAAFEHQLGSYVLIGCADPDVAPGEGSDAAAPSLRWCITDPLRGDDLYAVVAPAGAPVSPPSSGWALVPGSARAKPPAPSVTIEMAPPPTMDRRAKSRARSRPKSRARARPRPRRSSDHVASRGRRASDVLSAADIGDGTKPPMLVAHRKSEANVVAAASAAVAAVAAGGSSGTGTGNGVSVARASSGSASAQFTPARIVSSARVGSSASLRVDTGFDGVDVHSDSASVRSCSSSVSGSTSVDGRLFPLGSPGAVDRANDSTPRVLPKQASGWSAAVLDTRRSHALHLPRHGGPSNQRRRRKQRSAPVAIGTLGVSD